MYLNQNNNHAVTAFLAKKNYILHKKRNGFIIAAVWITTFLVTLILAAGGTYVSEQRKSAMKLVGTTAHASVHNLTEEQRQLLNKSSLVNNIGMELRLGTVCETGNRIRISYIDKVEWEMHRASLVEKVSGRYPKAENEIMAAQWILNDLGITEPKIGMSIAISYLDNNDEPKQEEFVLAGFFEEASYIRSGGKGSIYVSSSYALKEAETAPSVFYMDLMGNGKEKTLAKLSEELKLFPEQFLSLSPVYEKTGSNIMFTIVFLVCLITFSGYLVIYSIFYLSLSRDVKMYGKLITIGATERQIKQVLYKQIKCLCIKGVPAGSVFGFLCAYAMIPYFFQAVCDTKVNRNLFHAIAAALLAVCISCLTVILSCMKPVNLIAKMEPVDAIHFENYRYMKSGKGKHHKNSIFFIAWRNLQRKRKNTLLIILSFTVGSIAFLALSQFYVSISPKQYVESYFEHNIEITDESADTKGITHDLADKIKKSPLVDEMEIVERQVIYMEYDAQIFSSYMDDFQKKSGMDLAGYDSQMMSQQFWSYAYLIPDDYEEQGEDMVYLSDEYKEMIPVGTKLKVRTFQGMSHSFYVGGYVEAEKALPAGGMAPVVYLPSDSLIYTENTWDIYAIRIMCESNREDELLTTIRGILPNAGIRIESRVEWEKKLGKNMNIFYEVMGGMSLFLLFNGILNFINTMYSNIQERRKEFKVLDSIGMTDGQIQGMLLYEGMIYAGIISVFVVLTAGLGSGMLFQGIIGIAPYAEYHFPTNGLIFVMIAVWLICCAIPGFAYKRLQGY
ncbi:MAG: ABC transporter permease [Lachnoclostridium sp.]|nr:ABC transporter permease [Lachnospira sp.]MCM1248375.1 ABC transporter permease [Lachnoclostridium sp.]